MAEHSSLSSTPDDVDATLEHAQALGAESGAEVVSFENRYRTSNGDFRWISSVVVSDAEAMYFVARDVTESKVALNKLEHDASVMQAVLESVADGLYVADSHGEMTFINPAGVQLLGYESAAELVGRSAHATFHHSHAGVPYRSEECPLSNVCAGPTWPARAATRGATASDVPSRFSVAGAGGHLRPERVADRFIR